MVPLLVLLSVALWFIVRGDLIFVLPFVILFLCFLVLSALRLPRLGKRELILVLFIRLFDLCLFGFVGFLFLLVSGKGCGLWLWHSLDFSLTFFGEWYRGPEWGWLAIRVLCTHPPPPPPTVVCSADRSNAVVLVLVLLFAGLWFILRGDLFYVLSCVILFLCFLVLLTLRLPRLGKRELILVLFVRLFDLCLFGFVGFLFLLVSGKGCGLWLWHSLDFSLTCFWEWYRGPEWGWLAVRVLCPPPPPLPYLRWFALLTVLRRWSWFYEAICFMSYLVSFCSCVFRYFWHCVYLAWVREDWSWCFSYVCSICACLGLSVSSSSWCLGRAAVCDCGTPWTFLLPFFLYWANMSWALQ